MLRPIPGATGPGDAGRCHMSGGDRPSDGPVKYTRGRAIPPGPADIGRLTAVPDMRDGWSVMVEERLTAIEDNTFDLADQVRMLGHRVTVALLTTIAAIAALVAVAILGRG